jgi:hypothetical protein
VSYGTSWKLCGIYFETGAGGSFLRRRGLEKMSARWVTELIGLLAGTSFCMANTRTDTKSNFLKFSLSVSINNWVLPYRPDI